MKQQKMVASFVAFAMCVAAGAAMAVTDEGMFPFVPSYDSPDNVVNMSHLLEAPAGKNGRIRIEGDHFVNDKGRVKFHATNLTGPANFPTHEEAEACRIHLRMQTFLVRPKVIVLLGSTAAKNILGDQIRITRDRGKWTERKGVWIMPTYHPSALLRDESKKPQAWEDMKSLKEKLIALDLYPDLYPSD